MFHFHHVVFSSHLKVKVVNTLVKTVSLRINLNIDGVPITSDVMKSLIFLPSWKDFNHLKFYLVVFHNTGTFYLKYPPFSLDLSVLINPENLPFIRDNSINNNNKNLLTSLLMTSVMKQDSD